MDVIPLTVTVANKLPPWVGAVVVVHVNEPELTVPKEQEYTPEAGPEPLWEKATPEGEPPSGRPAPLIVMEEAFAKTEFVVVAVMTGR